MVRRLQLEDTFHGSLRVGEIMSIVDCVASFLKLSAFTAQESASGRVTRTLRAVSLVALLCARNMSDW